VATELPQPYLRTPFDASAAFTFLAGWKYDEAEIALHGVTGHGAIDFGLGYGTPVLAAADGYALAVWDERWLTDDDGSPKLHNSQRMTFGQGLTVQLYHGNGRYTQYGHLAYLPERDGKRLIPFHHSVEDKDGNLPPSDSLRALVKAYQDPKIATKVRAGTIIGYVGLTGAAYGTRTYDAWRQQHDGRTLQENAFPTYMSSHLHFVEFRRSLKSRIAERHDPFGLYKEASAYPQSIVDWSRPPSTHHHHSLWLPQS
jgi:murein DD-endopeptidase MepM/ murein hydrolase activator NlpD